MSAFARDKHKRASRVLGFALTSANHEAWEATSAIWEARLDRRERVALAWASMKALPPEAAAEVAGHVLGDQRPPNWPEPSAFNLMREAAFWADHASEEELGAYCLATFRTMPPERQVAFLTFVQRRKSI